MPTAFILLTAVFTSPDANSIISGMRMRLGKIEKYILVWDYQQHDSCRELHSKTGVMLSYIRANSDSRIPRHTYNLKALLSEKEYRNLHVSFNRALKNLANKGLVDYMYCPDPIAFIAQKRKQSDYGHVDFLGIPGWVGAIKKRYIRKSVFRLTVDGRMKTRTILKCGLRK